MRILEEEIASCLTKQLEQIEIYRSLLQTIYKIDNFNTNKYDFDIENFNISEKFSEKKKK